MIYQTFFSSVLILIGTSGALAFQQQDPPITVKTVDVATDFGWGYRIGVKQPLGSYRLGKSIYQISKLLTNPDQGSPDYVVWVDEHAGTSGIADHPAHSSLQAVNPGGMAVFTSNPTDPNEQGRIWLTYGARANDMPFNIAKSTMVNDPQSFDGILNDFITDQGSTTPCLHVVDNDILFTYRNGASSWAKTTLRFQRYNAQTHQLEKQVDLGKGYHDPVLGNFGIEQLWTRYDPRYDRIAASWQWFYVNPHTFGDNPFVYSPDHGDTWMKADDSVLTNLPIDYSQQDDVLVPFNHLINNENTSWLVGDIGFTPDGTPWMLLPHGNVQFSSEATSYFWFWDGTQWAHRELSGPMLFDSKPRACVTTRDYMVFVYSEYPATNVILARTSHDNGRSWSNPTIIDTLDGGSNNSQLSVCWITAVQPSDRYLDNKARFYVGYYREGNNAIRHKRYNNSIRFYTLQIGPESDFNNDQVVDTNDVIDYLNAWTLQEWQADFNDDGVVNTVDILNFLGAFANEH